MKRDIIKEFPEAYSYKHIEYTRTINILENALIQLSYSYSELVNSVRLAWSARAELIKYHIKPASSNFRITTFFHAGHIE